MDTGLGTWPSWIPSIHWACFYSHGLSRLLQNHWLCFVRRQYIMNLNFHSRNCSYFPLSHQNFYAKIITVDENVWSFSQGFTQFQTTRSLPDVVISHVAQFLSPSDLGNMRRVNRYFRQLFSPPHLWQGIRISMPRFSTKHGQLRIDLSILETIKLRGIKELELQYVTLTVVWTMT